MARPRSEDKQLALLEATSEIVAAQGLGAPTALIARRAGVAEGTLFRYFPTKDALLNATYLHLSHASANAAKCALDSSAPLREQMFGMWNNWIDWGVANPAGFSTMAQLEASDKLSPEAREEALKLCGDCQKTFEIRFAGLPDALSIEFFDAISMGMAQATINFILAHPEHGEAAKSAAFGITWRGLGAE